MRSLRLILFAWIAWNLLACVVDDKEKEKASDGVGTADGAAPSALILFDRLQSVSAFPVKETSDGFERVCRESSGQVEVNLNFVSTERGAAAGEDTPDRDQSIRPGDQVGESTVEVGATVTQDSVDLNLACLEPYPDADIMGAGSCEGVNTPTATIKTLAYDSITEKRGDSVAVALLIDHSGSMNGLVNPEDLKEDTFGNFVQAPRFDNLASDNNYRLNEARGFIEKLNHDDKLIVYYFNEQDGVKVACNGQGGSESEIAESCFGADHSLFSTQLDLMQGTAMGRTNLWDAVNTAWDFMKGQPLGARHIVVVSDGPDTCTASEHFRTGSPICGTPDVNFNSVREKVTAEWDTHKIRVSFVQFQAPGYKEHDPRQWEMACETGGQYVFINSENLSKVFGELQFALRDALSKIRYTLAGSWRLVADVTALGSPDPAPAGTPPGTLYGLEGTMAVKEGIFSDAQQDFPFAVDTETSGQDTRLVLRKPCSEESECTDAPTSCRDACSDQAATCINFAHPDGESCEGGVCCSGHCETRDSCPDR